MAFLYRPSLSTAVMVIVDGLLEVVLIALQSASALDLDASHRCPVLIDLVFFFHALALTLHISLFLTMTRTLTTKVEELWRLWEFENLSPRAPLR